MLRATRSCVRFAARGCGFEAGASCAWASPAVAQSIRPGRQRLTSPDPSRAPGQWPSHAEARRRSWSVYRESIRDSFPTVAVPTPPESPRDSLPSVTRLSGPGPDPWLCVLASQRVCLYREEGYALILYSAVNPIDIFQENLTPGALGH